MLKVIQVFMDSSTCISDAREDCLKRKIKRASVVFIFDFINDGYYI